jgi:hypothetical protein
MALVQIPAAEVGKLREDFPARFAFAAPGNLRDVAGVGEWVFFGHRGKYQPAAGGVNL